MNLSIEDILDPSLGALEWEANAHLFSWPGALIEGTGAPIVTSDLEGLPQKDVTDFGYRQRDDYEYPFPDRDRPDVPVPPISAREFRENWQNAQRVKPAPPKATFARPTAAIAFDQQQQFYQAKHPFPELLELKSWQFDVAGVDREAFVDGAYWAFAEISQAAVGFVIARDLVKLMGAGAIAMVLWEHLTADTPLERVEARLAQFQQNDVIKVGAAAALKVQRIRQQSERWLEAGHRVALNSDGSPNAALTLANLATALTALSALSQKATAYSSFGQGVEITTGELMRCLQRALPSSSV